MRKTTATLLLLFYTGTSQVLAADNSAVAKMLGWKKDTLSICKGHFVYDREVMSVPNPRPMNQSRTVITTSDQSSVSKTGASVLKGHVTIRQPGRLLKADKITILRNPKTHELSVINLFGNVSVEEAGKKIAATRASANLNNNSICAMNTAFSGDHQTPLEVLRAWGTSKQTFRDGHGNISLVNARYSVCPVINPMWAISARNIHLNNEKGVGSVTNAKFLLWGVPVFYLPYLSYPITSARKSGFLIPGLSYDEQNGFGVEIPYYFNLAPNYDDLFSASYMSKRGVKFNNHLRYLTPSSLGSLYVSVLPDDTEFRNFQKCSKTEYQGQPEFTPFLSRIENASPTRYSVSFDHRTTFNDYAGGSLTANFVSDDYYLHDFGSDAISSNTVNLFNQAEVHYHDYHWDMLARAMGYQTLHPIGNISVEPYNRVPQIALTGLFPKSVFGLDYELWLDYTNFNHRNDFITDSPIVSAHRIHALPRIGYNWRRPYAFFNPTFSADISHYWLYNSSTPNSPTLNELFFDEQNRTFTSCEISRVLPIGSVDAGLIFQRMTPCYRQTLEPRLYYLIIPRKNQNDIPLFDTTLPRFNFEQLFFYNRFSGYDRLGDANELTFALSSRFYENTTGFERFSTSVGLLYQFSKRSVCLTPSCVEDDISNDKWSPILFNATYHLTPTTYAQADVAWNPNDASTQTANVRFHWEPSPNTILHAGYDFVRGGDRTEESRQADLSRLDLSLALPLSAQWSALANWNYNLSHSHIMHYLAGLGYDSCCFAARGIVSRTALALNLDDNAKMDTRYYLEIKFKGLGTLGNARPSQLLDSSIVGYKDAFRG